MTGNISNGRRARVQFGPFERQAGVVNRPDGTMKIAFVAPAARLSGERSGTVDDKPVSVLSIEDSATTAGMVVVTAREIS